jgi:hypothetical protein
MVFRSSFFGLGGIGQVSLEPKLALLEGQFDWGGANLERRCLHKGDYGRISVSLILGDFFLESSR